MRIKYNKWLRNLFQKKRVLTIQIKQINLTILCHQMLLNLLYKKSVAASTITARMLKKHQRSPPLVYTKSDNFTKLDKLQDMAHLGLSEFVPRKSNKAEGTTQRLSLMKGCRTKFIYLKENWTSYICWITQILLNSTKFIRMSILFIS